MNGWRLLLTRPQAESQALAATLAEVGIFSRSLPMLDIEVLEEAPGQHAAVQGLDRYSALVVVSKPAARLLIDLLLRYGKCPPPSQRWFSVGAATAGVLDGYLVPQGLAAIYPAFGDDSEALLALPMLDEALNVSAPRVLIVRGEGGRELLADSLRQRGVQVDFLELYRRVLPQYPAGAALELVQAEQLNALLVSSGQGLLNLREHAGAAWARLARLPLLVPSPRVAEMARAAGAEQVIDCRGASAAAVLAALQDHAAPGL